MKIRNIKEIRDISLDNKIITLDQHLSWLKKMENDNMKRYFAIFCDDELLGGINIFAIDKEPKWGVFFKDKTSLIIKSIVPIYFINYFFDSFKCDKLFAEIKKNNLNAISYNKSLGFIVIEHGDIVKMQLDKKSYIKAKDGMILKRIIKKIKLYDIEMEMKL